MGVIRYSSSSGDRDITERVKNSLKNISSKAFDTTHQTSPDGCPGEGSGGIQIAGEAAGGVGGGGGGRTAVNHRSGNGEPPLTYVASVHETPENGAVDEVKMEAEEHLAREYVQEFVLDHLDPDDVKREVSQDFRRSYVKKSHFKFSTKLIDFCNLKVFWSNMSQLQTRN